MINEPGVYSLVFSSKLPIAKRFKDWVFREVLPSIRKTGQYVKPIRPIKPTKPIKPIKPDTIGKQMSLMDEADLHYQVVEYIRKYYPGAIVMPGLGENQDTETKRIESWKKGYRGGQPDIIIGNLHKTYTGLAIELKTPSALGVVSKKQKSFIGDLSNNGYKTLVSNDYDEIHRCIDEYMRDVRVRCRYCGRKFSNEHKLNSHCKGFHRISNTS